MTPLLQIAAVVIVPIALLIALAQLVGASDRPGDGFTAGIITSLGLTLQYLVFGGARARARLREPRFYRLFLMGLTIALIAAVLPIVLGEPLLAAGEVVIELPLVGPLVVSRGLVFDLAVYLVVLGGAMTIVDSLGRARRE